MLATTATANDRVLADLSAVLGPDLQIARGDLARPSLALQTISLPGQAERLAWLAERIPHLPGRGIVYTLTGRDAEQVAGWLRARGIDAEPYTSLTGPRRLELEQALLDNRLKALVPPPRSAWASTRPTWPSSSTTRPRPRWSPTTAGGRRRACA